MFPHSRCFCCNSKGTSSVFQVQFHVVWSLQKVFNSFDIKFLFVSLFEMFFLNYPDRLGLSLSVFYCKSCNNRTEPTSEDYIAAGLRPGCPDRFTILFHQDVLEFWYHLRILTLGNSEHKFLECLCSRLDTDRLR